MRAARLIVAVSLLCLLSHFLACVPTQNVGSSPQIGATPLASKAAAATEPERSVAIVKSVKANLRQKPSRSGAVIREVAKNDRLTLIQHDPVGTWYEVRDDKTGLSGWIHGNTIALEHANAQLLPSSSPIDHASQAIPTTPQRSYINVDGQRIPSPVFSKKQPAGATARCGDGSYSFSQHHRGTCSHHGGVTEWL
jgi:hypothetical protein